ncbi:hypothetical protein [Salinarchaeum laminariae]|uniref:hypothetical protein n=1 Tax=Salinarchaeum laminariae TaxID=869888 RepID=UPI0020C17A84|nr:hypothetical protein [Salinarchaeum laminariae]
MTVIDPTSARAILGRRLALAVVGLVGIVGVGLIAGPALAGDAVAQFEFGDDEHAAEPGDTVTVDVHLSSDGGYADEGIDAYEFVIAVPPAVGEPTTDVEVGPWLARDGGAVGQTVERVGDGAIRVQHERTDAENGVTGTGVVATVTIEIRDDAPAADAGVVVAETSANLYGNDYRMQSFGDETTIAISGGGEQIDPAYEPGTAGDGSVDVTTAAETNRSVADDGSDSQGDDSLPGFGIATGVAAVGLLLCVGYVSRRRSRLAD